MNMISACTGPSPGTAFLRDLCRSHFVHTETSLAIFAKVSSAVIDSPCAGQSEGIVMLRSIPKLMRRNLSIWLPVWHSMSSGSRLHHCLCNNAASHLILQNQIYDTDPARQDCWHAPPGMSFVHLLYSCVARHKTIKFSRSPAGETPGVLQWWQHEPRPQSARPRSSQQFFHPLQPPNSAKQGYLSAQNGTNVRAMAN